MTQIALPLFLDALVATLLVVTIVYCWRLNSRIRTMQNSKGELAQLIRKFDEATERASASIVELQTVSKKVSTSIKEKIDKANFIADDLSFMIDRGSKLADQMEGGIRGGRKAAPAMASKPVMTDPDELLLERREPVLEQRDQGLERRNEPMMERPAKATIRNMQVNTGRNGPAMGPEEAAIRQRLDQSLTQQAKTASTLESVLERIAKKPGTVQDTRSNNKAGRSRAERELLEALKTGG